MKFLQPSRTFLLAGILALTAAAYVQCASHLFVLDDHDLLTRVIASFHSIVDAWKTGNAFQSYYRPLFLTSLGIDHSLFGDDPAGFHVENLLLHLVAVWSAFVLAQRFFSDMRPAAAVALLFAVHPAHTENVSWISGRTDILCAIFIFWSLIAFYDVMAHGKPHSAWLAGLFFFLALASKEVAVIVPGIALVMLTVRKSLLPPEAAPQLDGKKTRHRKDTRKGKSSKRASGQLVRVFMLFAAGLIAFLVLRAAASKQVIDENIFLGLDDRLLNAARCFAMYLWHAFMGGGFEYIILGWRVADPQFNLGLPHGISSWAMIAGTVIIYGTWVLFAVRARRAVSIVGLLGFFLTVLPALGFVPILSIFSVRFLYIPSLFLAFAVVDEVRVALARWPRPVFSRIAVGAVVAVSLWWGVQTFQQDKNWHDDVTLMVSMKQYTSDSPVYYFCLGNGYRYRESFMEAANNFAHAALLYPEYLDAHMNCGAAYLVLGQTHPEYYKQAIAVFSYAIQLLPHNARLYAYLGDAFYRSGDEPHARENYLYAYSMDKSPDIRQRLVMLNVPISE